MVAQYRGMLTLTISSQGCLHAASSVPLCLQEENYENDVRGRPCKNEVLCCNIQDGQLQGLTSKYSTASNT